MNRLLSAVLLVSVVPASAFSFSLDSLGLSGLQEMSVEAPVSAPAAVAAAEARPVKRFTIEAVQVCDAGRFVLASWCPAAGSGVTGGLERVITVSEGDEVEIRLINRGQLPNSTFGIGDHSFRLTAAEPLESCSGAACTEFGVDAFVPLRSEIVVRFTAGRVGRFKYYDRLWPNGYGVLNVLRAAAAKPKN